MGGTIRKIVKNPLKAIKGVVKGNTAKSQPEVQQKVTQDKKKITPPSANLEGMSRQMEMPENKIAKKRGRRSNIRTGARGVTGTVATTKKTLLGS